MSHNTHEIAVNTVESGIKRAEQGNTNGQVHPDSDTRKHAESKAADITSVAKDAAGVGHAKETDPVRQTKVAIDDLEGNLSAKKDQAVAEGKRDVQDATTAGAGYLETAVQYAGSALATAQSTANSALEVTKGYISVAQETLQPHIENAKAVAQPYIESAKSTAQPHIDAATETVQRKYDDARQGIDPHVDAAKQKLSSAEEGEASARANGLGPVIETSGIVG